MPMSSDKIKNESSLSLFFKENVSDSHHSISTIYSLQGIKDDMDFEVIYVVDVPISIEDELIYKTLLESIKKNFDISYNEPNSKYLIDHNGFEVQGYLGKGAFGNVVLVQEKSSEKLYAMKILNKMTIVKQKQVSHISTEKKMLQGGKHHPFLMYLKYISKDPTNIYFILPYFSAGDLHWLLHKHRRFEESVSKFYTAQIVLGLEFMHYINIIYRDLKPENILLDSAGYIKISDFGFCKHLNFGRTYTFCGTPEYIAPEIILMQGYGFSVDWWSFGILLYELNSGTVPFKKTEDNLSIYNDITGGKYKMYCTFSRELRNLIYGLLQVKINRRLGCLKFGVNSIKGHHWFNETNWIDIFNKTVKPPIQPEPKDISEIDVDFEDEEYLLRDSHLSSKYFKDF